MTLGPRAASLAVWFPRARGVALCEETLPDVGPQDVRVRAVASALSHGTEMLVYRGQVPANLGLDLPTLRGGFDFPIKYGYASVGRVMEAGAAVESLHAGDLVFVHHPHQAEYVVPAALAVRLPPGLPPELGVFVANLETAVNALLDAHPRLGERLVIFGQGTVGLLLTQLARRAGAGLIVAVDPLATRRELAVTVGADLTLPPDADLSGAVRRLTEGLGADLALEASGNGAALQQAIECVAFQGTVVVCSWYGARPVTLHLGGAFHRDRLRIVSSQVSSIDPALEPRWSRTRRLALALDLLPSLQLAPLITHRIPFSRAAEAYALVDQHPEETVQVILTYDDFPSNSS
jgi:2-desacetyl-2-hydroxyethyl bacteriochlorophyllide A dehydrogenase